MKGIILAAGKGTRLYPASLPISKILLTIYDKPMIYYPLATLMQAGIRDILIITNPSDLENFQKVLGDGSQYGIRLSYQVQHIQRGIADAFLIGETFIGGDNVALILGDNLFHGPSMTDLMKKAICRNTGATVFGYSVKDPERFGVVEFDSDHQAVSLEEKPRNPKSHWAVTGLYFYDDHACEYAKTLIPSARGELEITDLNRIYLEKNRLHVEILTRGFAWLDTGTHDSMLQASNFVQTIELNTSHKIACLEEIAYQQGFVTSTQILENIRKYKNNAYYDYIRQIVLNDLVLLDKHNS